MSGAATKRRTAGFIGLGVMGWPMCRHMYDKQAAAGLEAVIAWDVSADARDRAAAHGVPIASGVAALIAEVDDIHLCLPGGPELEAVCAGPGGLIAHTQAGQRIIDHSTAPVPLTRDLATRFASQSVSFVDAPIARTRAAAEAGALVVMFGGTDDDLDPYRKQLSTFATDIVACGGLGAGQVVKQLNNMVLFQTVAALAEALATAEAAGVDGRVVFEAMMQGSGDSFALRNQGAKALLPGDFPLRSFSTAYARKDLSYAIELAEAGGLELMQANATAALFDRAIAAGDGDRYYPVLIEQIRRHSKQGDDT